MDSIEQPGDRPTNKELAICLLFFLLQLPWFLHLAGVRFIGGDEGFYLYASKLLLQGKILYRDFFFPQMPLMAWLYSGWIWIWGLSWEKGRWLSVAFSCGIGSLIALIVLRRSRMIGLAAIAVMLYAISDMVLAYYPIVKTYSPSVFFLIAACAVIECRGASRSSTMAIAGALFGAAIGIRIHFIFTVLAIALVVLRREPSRGWKNAVWFAVGATAVNIPALILFASDPGAYLFNNVGYHALRNREGLIGGIDQKIETLVNFLGYGKFVGEISYQSALLFFAALGSWLLARKLSLTGGVALLLIGASLLPTPVYLQYFCVAVPFLVIDACCGFSSLLTKTSLRSASVAAIVIWVVFYVRVVNEEYQRYTQTGDYVPGVANQGGPLHWKLKNLRTAAQEINRIARPGESVISTWPGYLVETTAEIYPGLENHFAISISHKLSPAERKRFHVISRQGFVDLVQDRAAPIVVLGYRSEKQGIRKTLNVAGYKRVTPQQPLHGVAIYRLP